eukprot:scaffold131237_cov23-Tisochrysis_lutea.AAC.1
MPSVQVLYNKPLCVWKASSILFVWQRCLAKMPTQASRHTKGDHNCNNTTFSQITSDQITNH